MIAVRLNDDILPEPFEAEPLIHLGTEVAVDVATWDDDPSAPPFARPATSDGGVATLPETYSPSAASLRAVLTEPPEDEYEVRVYKADGTRRLVSALEVVSPSNKDRPSHRARFAAKCASYLANGISVIVVDIVTDRTANLHGELIDLLHARDGCEWESAPTLYAVGYRLTRTRTETILDAWPYELALGSPLPDVPMWLTSDLAVPVELERTYQETCKHLKIR